MVGGVEDDEVALAGARARETKRQLVRLAARAHEITDPQWLWHRRREPFRVAGEMLIEIARVRIELADLPRRRFDHARVTVTDVWDVVVRIEVAPPGLVEEVLHRAAHHLKRPSITDADVAADEPPARRENLVVRHAYTSFQSASKSVSISHSAFSHQRSARAAARTFVSGDQT